MVKKRIIKRRDKRRSPISFTRRKRFIIYEALRAGLPLTRAAGLAGVTVSCIKKWKDKGKDKKRRIHYDFRNRVKAIQASLERESLQIIRETAKGGNRISETKITIGPKGKEVTKIKKTLHPNWQAAAWFLERRYKDDYGREIFDKRKEKDTDELAFEIKKAADALFASVPMGKDK